VKHGKIGRGIPDDFDDLVDAMREAGSEPEPGLAFRNGLKGRLMNTAAATHTYGIASTGAHRLPWKRNGPRPVGWPPVVGAGIRFVPLAAAVALLLAIVAIGIVTQRSGSPEPTDEAAGIWAPSPAGTPEGTPFPFQMPIQCTTSTNMLDNCGNWRVEGNGLLPLDQYADARTAVSNVQMQGWEVDPGKTVPFVTDNSAVSGFALDFVVGGAYQGVFSTQVTISRSGGIYEYPAAGTMIELARGDTVSYAIGAKEQMTNPLNAIVLKVKTVVVFADVGPGQQGATGSFRYRIDGEGTLPKPLTEFTGSAAFQLSYSNLALDPKYLQAQGGAHSWWVLGPVASRLVGGNPGSGFILWVSQPLG